VKSEAEGKMRFDGRGSTFDVEEKGKRRKTKGKSEENRPAIDLYRVLAANTNTGFY
jgi:hypothetical protein